MTSFLTGGLSLCASASTRGERARLIEAIEACKAATAASRQLDALIAMAVFPALTELSGVEAGIWRQDNGARVRALLYSSSQSAATTLIPPGCWIEMAQGDVIVLGTRGEWHGSHPIDAIALCIAALNARLAEVADAD